MKILNDNTHLKLWSDGHSPILFLQFKSEVFGFVNALEVYAIMNVKPIKLFASTHKELYLLLDLSNVRCDEIENLILYFERTLAKQIKRSFRYVGIVKSKSSETQYMNCRSEIPLGVFGTFFEALGSINDMRAKECVLN